MKATPPYVGGDQPSLIYEDNTGAISLVKNMQTNTRTKHILIRHHFLRELYESSRLSVSFVRSERNYADILTKNTPEAIFTRLSSVIREGYLDPFEVVEERINTEGTWRDLVLKTNPLWDQNEIFTDLGGRMLE